MSRSQLCFTGLGLLGFLALLATALPAPFTIDDCNYLGSVAGLRHGTLFIPGTAGLPASRALYAFEPAALQLARPTTPVPPLLPPLYGLVAYPFSYLGWNGLVLLNVLGCVATMVILFLAARCLTGQERAGWYAAGVWLLGASTVEYAQGLWPHLLTVALTTWGLALAALAADQGRTRSAATAGFLLALAAGMRYQNAVLLVCGLAVLVIWGQARLRTALAFVLGALPLVLLSSFVNHARIGSWHPFSKSVRYAAVGVGRAANPAWELLLGLWSKVVDYSAQPPIPRVGYLHKLPAGDMVTIWGVLKKSWLQASPWVLVALVAVGLACSRRERWGEPVKRHLRMLAVPLAAMLTVFGLAGIYRHDGLTFNQRYFLELGPLVALALAVVWARLPVRWPWLAVGGSLGAAIAVSVLVIGTNPAGYRLQSLVPLALAATATGLWLLSDLKPRPAERGEVGSRSETGEGRWFLARRIWPRPAAETLARAQVGHAAGLAIAACLAWSATIHFATDVPASRRARHFNLARAGIVEEALGDARPTAIVGAVGAVDAFCPLLLDRDAVIVSGDNVPPAELPPLLDALLARRRVLLWLETLPKDTTALLRERYRIEVVRPPMLAEIVARSPSAAGAR